MLKINNVLIALTAIFCGIALTDLMAKKVYTDTIEYCDYDGIYYKDVSQMYEKIKADGYTFSGFDYAYVCNINDLHIESLMKFPNVVRYGVTKGNVNNIPASVAKLKDLEVFQIHDQDITSIPPELGNLKKLRVLKLGGNKLKTIPPELSGCENLEILHLYKNNIESIPGEIGNLPKVKTIDLRFNDLSSLPKEMENASDTLESLYLGGNRFSDEEKEKITLMLPTTKIFF